MRSVDRLLHRKNEGRGKVVGQGCVWKDAGSTSKSGGGGFTWCDFGCFLYMLLNKRLINALRCVVFVVVCVGAGVVVRAEKQHHSLLWGVKSSFI